MTAIATEKVRIVGLTLRVVESRLNSSGGDRALTWLRWPPPKKEENLFLRLVSDFLDIHIPGQ